MLKEYAVIFQDQETGKVGLDKFMGAHEAGARRDFRDCYRHGSHRVLATVEIPEITKGEKK